MEHRLIGGYSFANYESLPDISEPGWEVDPSNKPLVIEHSWPNGQRFTVIGVDHFTDPGNVHYQAVLDAFERFKDATQCTARIVLVEGGIRAVEPTAEDAYRRGSESSLLAFLASQEGIEQDCIEPPHYGIDWLIGRECQLASGEEITLNSQDYIAWLAASWGPICLRRKVSYDEYALPRIQKELLELDWADTDVSLEQLYIIYQQQCGQSFDSGNKQLLLRQTLGVPHPPRDRIEAFARERYMLRHHHLALGFDFLKNQGISICATLGTPNVLIMKPWLDSLGTVGSVANKHTFSY